MSKSTLAVAAGRKLHFWTGGRRTRWCPWLDTLTCVGEHEGVIWDMATTADRSALATGGSDGMVKIWPLAHTATSGEGESGSDGAADTVTLAAAQPVVLSSNHDDIYSIAVEEHCTLQRRCTPYCLTSYSAAASMGRFRCGTTSSESVCRSRRTGGVRRRTTPLTASPSRRWRAIPRGTYSFRGART